MRSALAWRTRKLAVVLEDIYQPHNAAAVMRSCDAFGIQNVFVIENRYPLKISGRVDTGASKWLDITRFKSPTCTTAAAAKTREYNEFDIQNTKRAIARIKSLGYAVAASTLREDSVNIGDIPLDRPVAIMMGTELTGLSQTAHECADIRFKLDMLGFAQSLNLSVFTAVCLAKLSERIRAKDDSWKLSQAEKDEILLRWLEP